MRRTNRCCHSSFVIIVASLDVHRPSEGRFVLQLEVIADYACQTGERPTWHPLEQPAVLDRHPGRPAVPLRPGHRPARAVLHQAGQVGGFTIQADGSLLLFLDRGTVVVWRDGRIDRTVIEEVPGRSQYAVQRRGRRSRGRVYCGTMPERNAAAATCCATRGSIGSTATAACTNCSTTSSPRTASASRPIWP